MLKEFKTIKKEEGKLTKEDEEGREKNKRKMDKLVQLEPVDNLKNGVVANMVGVIAFLLEKYNYQVYISLEDLSKPFSSKIISGIDGVPIRVEKKKDAVLMLKNMPDSDFIISLRCNC